MNTTIKTIEETKKDLLKKLLEATNLDDKLKRINNLKEIDNNLIYYDDLIKKIGKINILLIALKLFKAIKFIMLKKINISENLN